MNTVNSSLIRTIYLVESLADMIRINHPEVERKYRNGTPVKEIINSVPVLASKAYKVAERALRLAVKSLLPPEERKQILRERRIKNGKTTYRDGRGIHAMGREERIKYATRASQEAGHLPWKGREARYNFIDGIFYHTHTTLSEEEVLLKIASRPIYQQGKKKKLGEITTEHNRLYWNGKDVRTKDMVRSRLDVLRRKHQI